MPYVEDPLTPKVMVCVNGLVDHPDALSFAATFLDLIGDTACFKLSVVEGAHICNDSAVELTSL